MTWDQLSINRPHLVYILLGAFTSIFMLVSLFIKEKLYIGEASVATIFGIIFGPAATGLINPLDWGNTDQITLEFSRIVLVVQCFAVGVELPKAYMERHWKSVVFLLVPVMAFGWLITSLFIWWLIEPLTWLESLAVAACVTATDPVLASSVVGKGKFAKRVPKHLRDLLSAESGCNDGMAFPFIYLALNLIHYHLDARDVVFHWTCYTILYECLLGAVYGVLVGYIARHTIRLAEEKGIIDRESFLVFYFVLALFCAGSGSLLGLDDLLVGFAAGVGFSNDGWFTEQTEESHVSNVIDLLLNLTYFVYFGTIIPWDQYNAPEYGLEPWRLVVIAILVIFFRRIPIMLALKPIIPDIKTWREALFAGHFGPIGVGAVFVAILARAELETGSTTPLDELPDRSVAEYTLIWTIWPITTFLIIASIVVHGSSIAVFTLGKRINTLTLTLSYTQDNEKSSAWMNRLPRIASGRSLSKMSDDEVSIEKDFPPGQLPPIGIPKLALRRQKDEEYEKERPGSRSSSLRPRRRKKKYDGGPISQSAIMPARMSAPMLATQESGSDTLNEKSSSSPDESQGVPPDKSRSGESSPRRGRPDGNDLPDHEEQSQSSSSGQREPNVEAYEEGHNLVVEDEEGTVIRTVDTRGRSKQEKEDIIEAARQDVAMDSSGKYAKGKHRAHAERTEGDEIEHKAEESIEQQPKSLKKTFDSWKGFGKGKAEGESRSERQPERKRGPAHAYQFGNTIIVEDEDGEVIRKIVIPVEEGQRRFTYNNDQIRQGLQRMGTWVGIGPRAEKVAGESTVVAPDNIQEAVNSALTEAEAPRSPGREPASKRPEKPKRRATGDQGLSDDDGLRLTISRADQYGLTGLQKRRQGEADGDATVSMGRGRRMSTKDFIKQLQQQMDPKAKAVLVDDSNAPEEVKREIKKEVLRETQQDSRPSSRRMPTAPAKESAIPEGDEEEGYFGSQRPTVGSRTKSDRPRPRRMDTGDSTASEEVPTHNVRSSVSRFGQGTAADLRRQRLSTQYEGDDQNSDRDFDDDNDKDDQDGEQETAAERRRRLAALGIGTGNNSESSDEENDAPRRPRATAVRAPNESPPPPRRIQWGGESGRDRGNASGKGVDIDTDQPVSGTGSVGKKLKGFLKR